MAFTPNQITDQFTSALKRPPTDYEISQFSNSSPQALATLKDTYAKLKPDVSISDYLTSVGQDSSLQNRISLGQKYGITNVGTAEGNMALLAALKSGTPGVSSPASVPGSIPAAAPAAEPAPDTSIPGSVSAAATSTATPSSDTAQPSTAAKDVTQPPAIPDVATTKTSYTQAQKAVVDVTSRIEEINNSIDQALANKKAEVVASGGVVDESQLRSTVLQENAPLITERNQLNAQRTKLVGEQNIAAKAYADAQAAQKQSDANFYKQKTLDQGQQKINNQQTQADAKLEEAGWKMSKVNITDAAGNVLGQKIVWSQNPSFGDSPSVSTSSGNGGIDSNGNTNVGNTAPVPSITIADGATPEQVLHSLISGPAIPVKGSTTPLSQQTLYNLAVQDMLGSTSTVGGRTPSGAIIAVKNKETDIMNAYGLTPDTVAAAKAQFKGMTAANTALLGTAAFTKTYASTANDNLQLALDQSNKVARSGAKLINNYAQWLQGNFTPSGDLAQFETYIYTAAREYAKVTSGGAKSSAALTDTAQRQVDDLLSASQSPEVFKKVVTAMQNDMNNVINNFDKQTASFPDAVKALYGLSSPSGTGTSDVLKPENVSYSLQSVAGGDGYVSPDNWNSMKKMYTDAGGKSDDFEKTFGKFKNPQNKNY